MLIMINECFTHLEEFQHADLFRDIENLWDPLDRLPDYMNDWFGRSDKQRSEEYQHLLRGVTFHKIADKHGSAQAMIVIQYPLRLQQPVFLETWKIFMGRNTPNPRVMPGTLKR